MKPGKGGLGKGAIEEQVNQSVPNRATKARQGDRVAERNKPARRKQNTMRNLPGQFTDLPIKIEEKELPPSTRPIKRANLRKELSYTMWGKVSSGQKLGIHEFGRYRRDILLKETTGSAYSQCVRPV